MSGGEFYDDGSVRESAKWAHDRRAREMAEHERVAKADLSCIHDGYYEEYDVE